MHVFKYSPRKGTKAAEMKNQISPELKEERSKVLIDLSHKNEKEYKEKFLGRTVQVLFEQKEGEYLIGHTTNYLKVAVDFNKSLENTIQNVEIANLEKEFLVGKIL